MNMIAVIYGKMDIEDLTYQITQGMNSKENSSEQLRMSTFWKELDSMSPSHARLLLANLSSWKDRQKSFLLSPETKTNI